VRILVVSGIWPPDVGGPATHAPETARYLAERGHEVEVLVTADGAPATAAYPITWVSRRLPVGVRHLVVAARLWERARRAEVVYTTGMFTRSALGAVAARRPFVVKLTGDPAFERARWRGIVKGDVEEFQRNGGYRVALLRRARDASLRRAAQVVCPSDYLRGMAISWGVAPDRVTVLPNPVPADPPAIARDELRRRFGMDGLTVAFAGRITAQKGLDVGLDALARTPGASLVVAGDGPERDALERRAGELGLAGRVRFLGAQPRERVLELFAAADAALLSSAWENFPHTLVEALRVGTPVVATAVGGVGEVVRDGENGLLVPAGDPAALAAAIERLAEDEELRARLRSAATASVADYDPERAFARLEEILVAAARRR
jgi:glycosyltransferase involved in cell wall biosynthesis